MMIIQEAGTFVFYFINACVLLSIIPYACFNAGALCFIAITLCYQ